jgi:hypothetical protein
MGWWLAQAAGVGRRRRSVGRSRGAGPVIGARKVALRPGLGVEDDVGYLACLPLMLEKREQLPRGTACVEVGQPYGDEAAVPAPLVG